MSYKYRGKGSRYKTYMSIGEQQAAVVFCSVYWGAMLSVLAVNLSPAVWKDTLQWYDFLSSVVLKTLEIF